jgi:hypothetical protein
VYPKRRGIKEDLRIVTVAWVGYNYIAQVATPVVVRVDQTVHCPRGPSLLETPIIHGRRGEAEAAGSFFCIFFEEFAKKTRFFDESVI